MWAGKSCSWGGIPKVVDQGSILQVLILAPNTILLQTFFTTVLLVYSSSKLCTTIGLIYTLTSTAMSMNNAFREIVMVKKTTKIFRVVGTSKGYKINFGNLDIWIIAVVRTTKKYIFLTFLHIFHALVKIMARYKRAMTASSSSLKRKPP